MEAARDVGKKKRRWSRIAQGFAFALWPPTGRTRRGIFFEARWHEKNKTIVVKPRGFDRMAADDAVGVNLSLSLYSLSRNMPITI